MAFEDEEAPRNLHEERSQATRSRILEAAQQEFVANGLEGTKLETVARRAGLNKSLIYRHFSTKEDLFRRVLELSYQKIRRAEEDFALPADPIAALEALCSFTLHYYLENRDMLVLIGIENLHKGVHLAQSAREEVRADSLMLRMRALVAAGEASGQFRSGLDPAELWLLLSAQCWMTVSNAWTSDFTFGLDSLSSARIAVRLENIRCMIRRFVASGAVLAQEKG